MAEQPPPPEAVSPLARIYGQPLTQLPLDLYIPPDAMAVMLDAFEGPLDLLLYLIRKANVNVLDIPMAPLTVHSICSTSKRCARTISNWLPIIW
jgi:segregation and condensation protein A